MKTKSKRFVNLATLCLALLGTTLLMEQPVKAYGRQDESALQQTNYDQEVDRGYREGYLAGSRPDAPKNPKRTLEYDPDSTDPHNGYNDGYSSGYSAGWHTTHGNSESQGEDARPSDNPQEKGSQEGTREKGKSESEQDDESQESILDLEPIFETIVRVFEWIYTWVFSA
ncbi:Uncharacterised protein [Streptococcus pyogenes]|nr:hypothetical protein [Streptococcus pyogenes]VGQ47968.1 hypothetical membrane associated protein [Streptococcus pyogenes]VHC28525.1 Uncharacterised protein [Streptococcus pyogenes]VHC34755.1 Uncharacterised protein [Streptococcus pyogenes]VHC45214.1 Uncharacterised protein [Streptococcus pyogenes]